MKQTITERFVSKIVINPTTGCWEWQGHIGKDGYGKMWGIGNIQLAHRFSYEYFIGSITDELVLDHLCRNRKCVNPYHLEPVKQQVNVDRGINHKNCKSHCPHGHEYTPENSYYDGMGMRRCRICMSIKERKYRVSKGNVNKRKHGMYLSYIG